MNKLNINKIIPILQKMGKDDLLIVDEALGLVIHNPTKYALMKWKGKRYVYFRDKQKNREVF